MTQDQNARGAITNYAYTTMGRLTQLQAAQANITLENGAVVSQRPTENYVYDISGRLIATQNANGSWTTRTLLAGSGYNGKDALVTTEYKPDSGVWQTGYDVHGNARKLTDALNHVTLKNYDSANRLTQVIRPSGFTDSYAYDALGQRIKHWNSQFGAGEVETTDYDMLGRIVSTRAFGGDTTSYAYAWNSGLTTAGLGSFGGWVTTTTWANAKTSVEKKDAFGHLLETTDLGNHKTGFFYDEAGRMVEYRDTTAGAAGGAAWTFAWTNTGRRSTVTNGAGTTSFTYDANGNIVSERLVAAGSGVVYKDQRATYDALDRVSDWQDTGGTTVPAASLHIEYDANGNVRNRTTSYSNTVGGSVITWVDWFRYDAVDRIVTDRGQLSGTAGAAGTTVVRGITTAATGSYGGTDYTYNLAGDRVGAVHTDNYYYYARPPGEDYYVSGYTPLTYRTDYQYDIDGQQVETGQQNDSFGFDYYGSPTAVTGSRFVTTAYTRDAMGRVTQQSGGGSTTTLTLNTKGQVTSQVTTGGGVTTTTTYSFTDGSGLYYLGQVVSATAVQGSNTQTTTNSYAWDAGAQKTQGVVTGTGAQAAGTSTYTLDAFGQVTGVNTTGGAPHTAAYVYDAAGQGIQTTETFNGSGPYYNDWYRMGGMQMWHYSARFDPRQGDTSGAYTVHSGETMQTIAQSLWGDASLWYKIAEANGLAANAVLAEGQQVTIPAGVWRVHQNANTYTPYDAGRFLAAGDAQLPLR